MFLQSLLVLNFVVNNSLLLLRMLYIPCMCV